MKQTLLIIDAKQDLMEGSPKEQGIIKKEKIIHNINTVIQKAIAENISIVL